jgi:hypothetical protein
MVRSPLRDFPPYDTAVEIPDDAFIPYEFGFGAVVALWRDWRKRRRERPRRRGRLLRRRSPAAGR